MSIFGRKTGVITYTVNKATNRDMYITVQNGEVVVNAPWYFTSNKIQQIVQEKKKWILSKMQEYDEEFSNIQSVKIFGKNYDIHVKYENIKVPELNLKANYTMKLDKDYMVKDNQVVIIDEFTGRLMEGRRYSDGLHQAIEAKEGVKIQRESKTLATITFQNYFRMYAKLSGMTGTALTEENEFREIYNLDVIVIPTNRPVQRIDKSDMVYKNESGKYKAIIEACVHQNIDFNTNQVLVKEREKIKKIG